MLGEQRTYHLDVPFHGSNFFAPSYLSKICNQSTSVADMQKTLKNESFTHLLINTHEIERLGGLKKFGFSKQGIEVMNQFLNEKTDSTWPWKGSTLYQLKG